MRVLTRVDRSLIAELLERDEFFWMDLEDPSEDDVRALGELFGIHPLALEDTTKFGQRPKIEDFGDYVFVVFFGAGRQGESVEPIELHLFVSGSWILTTRRQPCPELDQLHGQLEGDDRRVEQWIVYRIFDTLTDSFFPVLRAIDDEIDALEDAVIEEPTDQQLVRIFGLKRELLMVRKVVAPQRDMFARGIDQIARLPGLEPGARDYFRDVYDHLIRISDMLDTYRDVVTGAMDFYMSTVSNRLNQVMKQLTIVATVFLPLTFVTGFFGQNFGWMVEQVDSFEAFLLLGVGGIVAAALALVAWFRRSGWI